MTAHPSHAAADAPVPEAGMACSPPPTFPERALAIRRACVRFCLARGWACLHEVSLPNGRRADILALSPDGRFSCIEIKSGERDFLADRKWPEYREYSDRLLFAVDPDFPQGLLPEEAGLIVAADGEAALLRDSPRRSLPPARRRALTLRFATLAARRLAWLEYPAEAAELRAALRPE